MGETTTISWCTATWNPWQGCEPVSPGCINCYAEAQAKRWGRDFRVVHRSADRTFNLPRRLHGERVFTCSVSDFFHPKADPWRPEAWRIIRETPDNHYLILTKRHGRIRRSLPADWGDGYPNVALGVSVEDQFWADRRIPMLLGIPARVRFLSMEPLLGPVDLGNISFTRKIQKGLNLYADWKAKQGDSEFARALRRDAAQLPDVCRLNPLTGEWFDGWDSGDDMERVHWIIVGGESGPRRRPFDLEWARSVRDQCLAAGVPFFFKQAGGLRPETGRELDGRTWEELPAAWQQPAEVRV